MYRVFITSIKPFFYIDKIHESFELTPGVMVITVNIAFLFEVLINFNTGYCEDSNYKYF